MFIKKVIIGNYKCFQEKIEVEFYARKIIAIVGKNSTGKTSLLEYIENCFSGLNRPQYTVPQLGVEFQDIPYNVVYCNLSHNSYRVSNGVVNHQSSEFYFIQNGQQFYLLSSELQSIDLSLIDLKFEITNNILVFKRGDCTIYFDNLSSGEKVYINLMALLNRYKNNKTLFLLDEPDTFMNPSLKMKYINLFEKILQGTNSEIIFTTHSCDLLCDLQENQVYLCSNQKIENIDFNPFGLSKEVIKKKLFKIEYSVSEKVENMFKEINRDIKKLGEEKNFFINRYEMQQQIIELESKVSQLFADSPLKDELFRKLDNLKRG